MNAAGNLTNYCRLSLFVAALAADDRVIAAWLTGSIGRGLALGAPY